MVTYTSTRGVAVFDNRKWQIARDELSTTLELMSELLDEIAQKMCDNEDLPLQVCATGMYKKVGKLQEDGTIATLRNWSKLEAVDDNRDLLADIRIDIVPRIVELVGDLDRTWDLIKVIVGINQHAADIEEMAFALRYYSRDNVAKVVQRVCEKHAAILDD